MLIYRDKLDRVGHNDSSSQAIRGLSVLVRLDTVE